LRDTIGAILSDEIHPWNVSFIEEFMEILDEQALILLMEVHNPQTTTALRLTYHVRGCQRLLMRIWIIPSLKALSNNSLYLLENARRNFK
jgi:hypothetical protein